ncbi:MAG TPA: bacteriohopanetetrol glucosamine biosynthesis glycosyltransferase HpnI [Bryobacteraceae bacterium]|nr:bacteriohopanetetrol glucosamine biosynthesis glycosyltransferase HpnI [Bryobacteraceae bacterium]
MGRRFVGDLRRHPGFLVKWLAVPALAAAAYYLLALIAALRWRQWRKRQASVTAAGREPAVSILKPVHGRDPRFYQAIRSHAEQDYSEFEILFGVSDPRDAALTDIERLQREFPAIPMRVVAVSTDVPNTKAGVLAELSRQARHPLLLVNDSDIVVERGYLRAVAAPLEDPKVGLVTCLYRAGADSWPAQWEALGIATEFAPSVLVARLLGMRGFALGSTMAFRAATLREAGGFEAIAGFLADDYQLGRNISQLGYGIVFAPAVVETNLGSVGWSQVWRHQLRWSRTIRVSRRSGYYGYLTTHAVFWSLVAFAARLWWVGGAALAVRILAALAVGAGVLRDRKVWRLCWLIPARDLFGFAVWLGGIFGTSVDWRGEKLRLYADGRISRQA